MDYAYGLDDMPSCDDCDVVNNDGGGWPGSRTTSKKRDTIEEDENLERLQTEALGSLDEGEDQESHFLAKRPAGEATLSTKAVKVCGSRIGLGTNARYPAFPEDPTWPWDGIEDNAYSDVSAYWGNTSADCVDWSVGQLTTADTENRPGGTRRALYDSKTNSSLMTCSIPPVLMVGLRSIHGYLLTPLCCSRARLRGPAHRRLLQPVASEWAGKKPTPGPVQFAANCDLHMDESVCQESIRKHLEGLERRRRSFHQPSSAGAWQSEPPRPLDNHAEKAQPD